MFSAKELQKIFSGDDSVKGIDVEDLKRVMVYSGGYVGERASRENEITRSEATIIIASSLRS